MGGLPQCLLSSIARHTAAACLPSTMAKSSKSGGTRSETAMNVVSPCFLHKPSVDRRANGEGGLTEPRSQCLRGRCKWAILALAWAVIIVLVKATRNTMILSTPQAYAIMLAMPKFLKSSLPLMTSRVIRSISSPRAWSRKEPLAVDA